MRQALFKRIYWLFVVLLAPVCVQAADFGLITNQHAEYGNKGAEDNGFEYSMDVIPHFSFLTGDSGEFYFSTGITLGYDDDFYFVPELLRTELSMRLGGGRIKAGRVMYSDPLNFIVSGLFDGVQYFRSSNVGTFSIGAWYTGLIYKKTADITMTAKEQAAYNMPLDYNDFYNTYFAPPRLIGSLEWEHPSIGRLLHLQTSVTGQIDFSDADQYHSQYVILKAGIPAESFLFELGGSLEFAQNVLAEESRFTMAFAGMFGVFWTLPASFSSRLSFTGRIAGGRTDDFIGAFVPVTTRPFGDIFQCKLSGVTVIGLNYTARVSQAFGASVTASHFVRNDRGTFTGYPVTAESDGYFLGTEFFARLIWSPFSDLQLNFGAGAFLPSLGNVSDGSPLWRAELTAALAFY
jgi:hypothetical protein